MAKIKTGGPAFASPGAVNPNGGEFSWPQDGMTLRQWYAGKAMASLLTVQVAFDRASLENLALNSAPNGGRDDRSR